MSVRGHTIILAGSISRGVLASEKVLPLLRGASFDRDLSLLDSILEVPFPTPLYLQSPLEPATFKWPPPVTPLVPLPLTDDVFRLSLDSVVASTENKQLFSTFKFLYTQNVNQFVR